MALPLGLRFQSDATHEIVTRDLYPIVGQFAFGAARLSRCRSLGFEQLELAAVPCVAQRRAATRAARAHCDLSRDRAEPGVVELAHGRVEAARESTDAEHAPAPAAARSLDTRRAFELGVARGARYLESGAHRSRSAVRVRQLLGNHIHHAAQSVGAV